MNKNLLLTIVIVGVLLLVICGCLSLLGGLAFWIVWNHIIVPLFSVEKIGYWTAVLLCWALSFLAGVISRSRAGVKSSKEK